MTAQSNPEGALRGARPDVQHFGSSMYGGRPTFALVRRAGPDGATLTLYELLPDEQAHTRKDRLERTNRSLAVEPFGDIFEDSAAEAVERWSWAEWTAVKVARLSGSRLRAVLSVVRETLEEAEIDPSAVAASGDGEAFLPEVAGVRLALVFAGVKPIQRVDRMRALARGVAHMSDEECYYWYAKCRSPSSPNGEKALRTLMTEHIH